MLHSAKVSLVLTALALSGCVSLDLASAADSDENSKIRFRDVSSAYCWDWGMSAQELLLERIQCADGTVDERGMQSIVISQTWWEVLATLGSLGIAKPSEYTIVLEAGE